MSGKREEFLCQLEKGTRRDLRSLLPERKQRAAVLIRCFCFIAIKTKPEAGRSGRDGGVTRGEGGGGHPPSPPGLPDNVLRLQDDS